ncbi:P-loop nucleoside triphosphate hydrolase, putative [Rhizoctonia solani AG-3 Rhs1AP]|uniref:p-loop nucleoside triphosphate hydrolase, putative n=1 Tax=Rhizoctonia solani AG-3 Rhs1AP TaxID=1086054 RepID=X8J2G7_9AGAM|nr:P-loop nucleoside triphosphate hydrolase, putative [Rhizoctonia solani AG-3 Rhs1AP]
MATWTMNQQPILSASPPVNQTTPTFNIETLSSVTGLSSLFTILLSFSGLRDWLKLIVLGGALETFRRVASSLWQWAMGSFFVTVHLDNDDVAYDWMMIWLSLQPAWRKAREVQISSKDYGLNRNATIVVPGETGTTGETRSVAYLPTYGSTHTMFFRHHWMRVTRTRQDLGEGCTRETLEVSILARNRDIVNQLLREAKEAYTSEDQNRVSIYTCDQYNCWHRSASRAKRPMQSIVLDPMIKDRILEDAKDFMASENWYSERGIPFRRGYLLHGAPGSGKTSLIHALAGELKLDVYVISLSRRGFDDARLHEIISDLPPRAIALIEDIDASFTTAVGVRGSSAGAAASSSGDDGGGVTLAGLLAAIDGVAAQEGRLLFATTNHIEVLDPALTRPGRMDVHVEFRLASKWQAKQLFKGFFPPVAPSDCFHVDEVDFEEKVSQSVTDSSDSTLVESEAPRSRTPSTASIPCRPAFKSVDGPVRSAPKLSAATVEYLAQEFANAIPEEEVSMAALQGHLMCHKRQPKEAVDSALAWIARERQAREVRMKEAEKENSVKVEPASPSHVNV